MTERIAGAPTTAPPPTSGPAPSAPPDPPVAPAAVPAPAPAVTLPVVTMTPPPATVAPEAPAPTSTRGLTRSQLEAELAEAKRLREQAAADAEATAASRAVVDAAAKKITDAARVRALRDMGAVGALSDADLLALAPDVDASTAAGVEALIAFKTARPHSFASTVVRTVAVEDMVSSIKPDRNGLWSQERLQAIAQSTIGGGA